MDITFNWKPLLILLTMFLLLILQTGYATNYKGISIFLNWKDNNLGQFVG